MTVIVDDDPEFKAIRARFYRLGKVMQGWILEVMGCSVNLSGMDNAAKKGVMIDIALKGRLEQFTELILLKEKEKEASLYAATQQDGDKDAGM
jgi:hypothetical protein